MWLFKLWVRDDMGYRVWRKGYKLQELSVLSVYVLEVIWVKGHKGSLLIVIWVIHCRGYELRVMDYRL